MTRRPAPDGTRRRLGRRVPSRVARRPRRADGVQLIGEMEGSGYREPPALVRRGDGQTIQLTAAALPGARRDRRRRATSTRSAAQVSAAVRPDGHARANVAHPRRRPAAPAGPADRGRRQPAGGAQVQPAAGAALQVRRHRPGADPAAHRARSRGCSTRWSCCRAGRASSACAGGCCSEKGLASATYEAFDKPGPAAARRRGHRSCPPASTSSATPPAARRGGATPGRDGRRALPRLAGVLHRRHRLLPARPRRPGAHRPRRPLLQRDRRGRHRRRLVGHAGTTRCCWSSRPRSCRWCAS